MIDIKIKKTKKGWVAILVIDGGNPTKTTPQKDKLLATKKAIRLLKAIYL